MTLLYSIIDALKCTETSVCDGAACSFPACSANPQRKQMIVLISEQEIWFRPSLNKESPLRSRHMRSPSTLHPHMAAVQCETLTPLAHPCSSFTAGPLLVPLSPSVRRATLGKQELDPVTLCPLNSYRFFVPISSAHCTLRPLKKPPVEAYSLCLLRILCSIYSCNTYISI